MAARPPHPRPPLTRMIRTRMHPVKGKRCPADPFTRCILVRFASSYQRKALRLDHSLQFVPRSAGAPCAFARRTAGRSANGAS